MSGTTPGQAAYEATQIPTVPGCDFVPWEQLPEVVREFWNNAGNAAAAAAVDPTAQDYDNAAEILKLRCAIAEILSEIELGTLSQHTPAATTKTLARTAQWRQRAGITPELATAGTQHLLDPGNPDGPAWQKLTDRR